MTTRRPTIHPRDPERSRQPSRTFVVLRALVLISSVSYIGLYAVLVCLRVNYPFELEWLEGTSVDHVRTILAGRPLYARPSLEFIPLTYTPGYFYLAAGVSKIFGVGFLPLRLISIAASAGLLGVLFRLASREAQDFRAGVLAAGLFAAMFGWTDGWLDLARTDSLFLLLACSTIYVLRWHTSIRATILAGLLISLAFLVKQTGVIVALPLGLYVASRGWRAFTSFAGTVAVIVLGTSLLLDRAFEGWYLYYVVGVPRQHPLAFEAAWGFWRFDLLRPLPLALVASVAWLIWRLRQADPASSTFYLASSAGLFAGAWASRLHSLSFINVVLPAYAALSVLFALAVHEGSRSAPEGSSRTRRLLPVALQALALLQLIRLTYAPARLVPTNEDVSAGHSLMQRLAAMPGEVFVSYHGYLPSLAGKNSHAHAVVIADVIRGGVTDRERALAEELEQSFRTSLFDSIISVDGQTPMSQWLPIDRYYRRAESVVDQQSHFWRPEVRFVPAAPDGRVSESGR